MAETKQDERLVQGIFHLPEDRRIYYANVTRFSHIGSEVLLDIGVLDEQKIIEAAGQPEKEPINVDVYIQYRIAFGLPGFLKLKANVDEIMQKMMASGVIGPSTDVESKTTK